MSDPVLKPLREELAELCHEQWADWMKYQFGKVEGKTIPDWAWDRWQRQAFASYDELSEEEKESDRREADRFLAILSRRSPDEAAIRAEAQAECWDAVASAIDLGVLGSANDFRLNASALRAGLESREGEGE